jgi:hypothetical protein
LLWAEGESHRRFVRYHGFHPNHLWYAYHRQRKALSPAFSNAAIRKLTPIFYDAAYKVSIVPHFPILENMAKPRFEMKDIWDSTLDTASGETFIDVQTWYAILSISDG